MLRYSETTEGSCNELHHSEVRLYFCRMCVFCCLQDDVSIVFKKFFASVSAQVYTCVKLTVLCHLLLILRIFRYDSLVYNTCVCACGQTVF